MEHPDAALLAAGPAGCIASCMVPLWQVVPFFFFFSISLREFAEVLAKMTCSLEKGI